MDKVNMLVYSEAWGKGGIEAFVTNVSPLLVAGGFEICIFSTWDWEKQDDSQLERLGIKRISAFHGRKPSQINRLINGPKRFRSLLDESRYDIVWINTMNGMGFQYAREAMCAEVPIRIVHSHNTDVGEGAKTLKRMMSKFGEFLWGGCSNVNLACSQDAGAYLFGKRPFEVISNGVDIERFRFDADGRKRIREKLGIAEKTDLVGNIGRINSQKNPLFQVEVFAEYKKLEPNSAYLMVGRPDMADEVLKLAETLGVADSLIIHEPVSDTAPYYWALDAMLMPSLYEGLGFVRVEAQCASLPVLCTDTMPEEADITELSQHNSLSDSPKGWAIKLHRLVSEHKGRRTEPYCEQIRAAGFTVDETVSKCLSIMIESRRSQ